MLLPVPEIFLDNEASKLCTEIQLNEHSKEISRQKNAFELNRREVAHAKEFIAAQHAQQASLDALALRFETDCLAAEDRLEEFQRLETHIKEEFKHWEMTESERTDVYDRAVQEGKNQSQEIAELHRQLETSSIEAAAASQASTLQKSNTLTANLQAENIRKALNAAQEEAAVLRRRLDETELALAERTAALKMEAKSAIVADEELLKALKKLSNAKQGLDDELNAGKELSVAATDAERQRVEAEKCAKAAQDSLQDARQHHRLVEMELQKRKFAAKQAEVEEKGALAHAGHSAQCLAESLQRHQEMEEAQEAQEHADTISKEHIYAFLSLAVAKHQQNAALDRKIAELSKQKVRLQQERENLKEKCIDRETALSNTQAQSKALDSKADKLREQLQHHEGALYRIDFQLFMAKRAAALAAAAETSSGTHSHSPESLRLLKQELHNELENARIAQKKQVRGVWEVEAAAKQVEAAGDVLQQEINKLAEQQKIEDLALKTAESSLQMTTSAREDAQITLDRAEMSLKRSQERFEDKEEAVLQLSAAVDEDEELFKTHASKLESKLQELSTDHHAAINALQASKHALTALNVAASTAAATLSTLQLKTQQPTTGRKNSSSMCITTATIRGGGVAGVCAEMQRQVKELQAALDAAETDCDILEQALIAQKQATVTANRAYNS